MKWRCDDIFDCFEKVVILFIIALYIKNIYYKKVLFNLEIDQYTYYLLEITAELLNAVSYNYSINYKFSLTKHFSNGIFKSFRCDL